MAAQAQQNVLRQGIVACQATCIQSLSVAPALFLLAASPAGSIIAQLLRLHWPRRAVAALWAVEVLCYDSCSARTPWCAPQSKALFPRLTRRTAFCRVLALSKPSEWCRL